MPALKVVAAPGRREVWSSWPLEGGEVIVGRGRGVTISLEDPSVSRRHVLLRPSDGGWEILDGGSANGARVNGVRLSRRRLLAGDRIEVGATLLEYVDDAEPAVAPPYPVRRGSRAAAARGSGRPGRTVALLAAAAVGLLLLAAATFIGLHALRRPRGTAPAGAAVYRHPSGSLSLASRPGWVVRPSFGSRDVDAFLAEDRRSGVFFARTAPAGDLREEFAREGLRRFPGARASSVEVAGIPAALVYRRDEARDVRTWDLCLVRGGRSYYVSVVREGGGASEELPSDLASVLDGLRDGG